MDLPKTCCKNIGGIALKFCDKAATHWYIHEDSICSYCDEHNYQCGIPIPFNKEPVACRSDFVKKYKTQDAWKLPIEEFIRRAPSFKGEEELAKIIGIVMADIEFALRFPT